MNRKQQQILKDKIGKTVLISIGINHYCKNDEFGNLSKCINDANEVYSVFQKVSPLNLNKEKSTVIVSNKEGISTSKNSIIESIKSVCEEVETNEKIVLFFSGHGHVLDNDNYLVPSDCENIVKEELIKIDDIINILEESKSKVKIILLDACCSGVIDESVKGLTETKFKYMKNYIENTRTTAIISACGKTQSATEQSPNPKLSLFTTYLVEALEGNFDALDNGYLTVNSLYEYVWGKMKKTSREYIQINQSPNLNVKANNIAVIGLYNYQIDDDCNDFDNYYRIKLDEKRITSEESPYGEIEKKGRVLISDELWKNTQLFLNEMILNIFDHGNAQNCNLQFSNNKIILSDDGEKFNATKDLINVKESLPERGNGLFTFKNYTQNNTKYVDVDYTYEGGMNRLIISFKDLKAFDIEGLCTIEVKNKWLMRCREEDIILPSGNCKKYYYIIDMISPCISIVLSAVNIILSVIPSESKLVVIDKNNISNYFIDNYEPNPRIIYRDK